MWHGVVGQAEEDAVERRGRNKIRGIALVEFDIATALPCAPRLRSLQHAGRKIDAIDASARPDGICQIRKAYSCAAADFGHAAAVAQLQMLDRAAAQIRRQEQQAIEQWNESG
jgi:hypothetical protein